VVTAVDRIVGARRTASSCGPSRHSRSNW
jgi:hypothetical protein